MVKTERAPLRSSMSQAGDSTRRAALGAEVMRGMANPRVDTVMDIAERSLADALNAVEHLQNVISELEKIEDAGEERI